MLEKTRRVMGLVDSITPPEPAMFVMQDDDDERQLCYLELTAPDWEAMGSPEQITVTIEPGDQLNGSV